MSDHLPKRLRELSDAVAGNRMGEFSMRVPAERERDADLVLDDAANEIERLREALRLIACRESIDLGDMVDIARKALAGEGREG